MSEQDIHAVAAAITREGRDFAEELSRRAAGGPVDHLPAGIIEGESGCVLRVPSAGDKAEAPE